MTSAAEHEGGDRFAAPHPISQASSCLSGSDARYTFSIGRLDRHAVLAEPQPGEVRAASNWNKRSRGRESSLVIDTASMSVHANSEGRLAKPEIFLIEFDRIRYPE